MAQRILFVDPDDGINQLAVMFLTEEGYEVTTVLSVEDAVEVLRKSRFDLIVTEAFSQRRWGGADFDPIFLNQIRRVASSAPIVLFSTFVDYYGIRPGQFGLIEVVVSMGFEELVFKVNKLLRKANLSSTPLTDRSDETPNNR